MYDKKALENLAIEITKENCREYMAIYKKRLRYQQRVKEVKKRKRKSAKSKRTIAVMEKTLEETLARERGLENEIKNGIARLIIEEGTEEFLWILRKKVEEELKDAGWKI